MHKPLWVHRPVWCCREELTEPEAASHRPLRPSQWLITPEEDPTPRTLTVMILQKWKFCLSIESWGAHVVIFLILATSLMENKSFFFSGLADGNKRKSFPGWPSAGKGGCPGFPQWPGPPLPMVSFLLMNILFVLF